MIGLYRVDGDSMSPSLIAGDYVITWRLPARRLRPGQIVVADHPKLGRIIKRIDQTTKDGHIVLSGDNRLASTSSEDIGLLPAQRLRGVVIYHIRTPDKHRGRS